MNKIGLLAVKTHNYGSLLQTYALQKVLDNMGYENEIINYKKTNMLKQAMRLFNVPLLRQSSAKLKKRLIIKTKYRQFESLLQNRSSAFDCFIKENLNFSSIYKGRNALIDATKLYSCFVLGSDQVWNPMNYGADFFSMTFVPDKICKVAYAPSFGVLHIPRYQRKGTAFYLDRIDYLSVREKSGQKIIKELTGRNAPIVADPTILLERSCWDMMQGRPIIKSPYIMCYFLSNNKKHRNYAKQLRQRTGIKIVTLPHMDEFVEADIRFGDIVPENIGPKEFVNLISNANYICTDSFHGTVFSILYQKKFLTFNRYTDMKSDSTNSRLDSILSICGLMNRKKDSAIATWEDMVSSIDYTLALSRLERLRMDSYTYLKHAIENAGR